MPKKSPPVTPPPATRRTKANKEVSAMGWIEDEFGKVLMVKQRRGRKLWSLPGGKVRANESLATAVAREIFEETGFKIRSATACDYYDRHEKANLTVLYRILLKEVPASSPDSSEIESAAFRTTPPKNSTPSLLYFWERQRRTQP